MNDAFIILGAGGHGKVVADLARSLGREVYGFVDVVKVGEIVEPGGSRVVLAQEDYLTLASVGSAPTDHATIAIGDNKVRLELFHELKRNVNLPTLVHPTAHVSLSARLGLAGHVCPMVVVHTAASIGDAVILNTRSLIEHDCVVGDGVHISPGAVLCGGVTVGRGAWIGAGAVVIPGLRIGENATVGAGAVVIRDVLDGATVVGNPAKPLRQ